MHKPPWVAVNPAPPEPWVAATTTRVVDKAPNQRLAWPWATSSPGGGQTYPPRDLQAVREAHSVVERTAPRPRRVSLNPPQSPEVTPRAVCPFTAQPSDAVTPMATANPSPFDQIARTDAEGNAFWSARDLMPLMGYRNVNAWQPFRANVIRRAEKSAENTGMTCQFTHVSEVIKRHQGGTTERADVHLDRMAAYLVAMNGDPNKPEVAAAQAYFAMQTRRAELGEATKRNPTPPTETEIHYFDPRATEPVNSAELAREVGNAVAGAMAPVVAELSTAPPLTTPVQ